MRSGSPAHDGRGWSPAQHPNAGRGGAAAQSYSGPQAEFDSGEYRQLVDSSNGHATDGRGYVSDSRGYAADSRGYAADSRHSQEPRYGPVPGNQQVTGRQRPGAGYQPPAYRRPADDYGYGDPGYADPSYDGPRDSGAYQSAPVAAPPPAFPPPPVSPPAGYQRPWPGAAMGTDQIYPVTGAQEVYREEPRQEEPRQYDEQRQYEEPRYEEPRHDDRRGADPRLAGIRYDELRYDELRYDESDSGDQGFADSRYDEPLDDDAWYEELRRGGPAFQPQPPGPASPGPAGPGPGTHRHGPGFDGGHDRSGGYPPAPGNNGNNGGNGNGGYGGYGPRMSAVPAPGVGSGPMVGLSRAPGVTGTPAAAQASPVAVSFQAAPAFAPPSSVGVLTPPAGTRHQSHQRPQAFGSQPRLAAAPTMASPMVKPAPVPHAQPTAAMPAMTGPDTVAWDIETAADGEELQALEQVWQEDDGGYSTLLDDLEEDADARTETGSQPATPGKRAGRRRGRSSDHRLWLGLVGVAAVAGAAIFGIVKFEFPSSSGPSHELVMPASVGSYQWAQKLEKPADLGPLIQKFRAGLGSSATDVVAREYESGSETTGSSPQLFIFVGGHLPNQSPASSLHNFIQDFTGAQVVSAGPMGGAAACTQVSVGTPDQQAVCAWFDNDSVGSLTSPTMSVAKLAQVMLQFRPQVEHITK
jgi:hypothetical protein